VTQAEVVEAMYALPSTRHDQLKGDLLWVVWAATDAARLIVVVLVREDRDSAWRVYSARPMTDLERDYWLKETS
jgi:hypothetical protein